MAIDSIMGTTNPDVFMVRKDYLLGLSRLRDFAEKVADHGCEHIGDGCKTWNTVREEWCWPCDAAAILEDLGYGQG